MDLVGIFLVIPGFETFQGVKWGENIHLVAVN